MELILWLLVSYYLADHLITDTAYAVRGLDTPRHKERMARIESGGKPSSRYQSGRNGASRFFAEAWHDAWDDAHGKRQELREKRQAKKAGKDGTAQPGPAETDAEPQPDGDVDTPGALRPQESAQEPDDNVIPLDTRRPSSASASADPEDGGGGVDAPEGPRPQQGPSSGSADPTVPPDAPDATDDAHRWAAEPGVVHDGPSPYELPPERIEDDPYPDLHSTLAECAAHEATLDGETRQVLSAIGARFDAANGAPIPVTVIEQAALLQARGYPPAVARKAAEDLHEGARRRGGTLMAQRPPTPGRARETTFDAPAADDGSTTATGDADDQSGRVDKTPAVADGEAVKESQEGNQMSVMTTGANSANQPSGETAGLGSAIRFAAGMAKAMRDAAARTEQSMASLSGSEVGQPPIDALNQAMEFATNAAHVFEGAQNLLEKQLSVKEAYDANPDAGNKRFLQND